MDGETPKGYISRLRTLIEKNVENFIAKAMKPQYEVDNGHAPVADAEGTGRIGQLQRMNDPRYTSPGTDVSTTMLNPTNIDLASGKTLNNNPDYPINVIDRLNTPFEYIERIMLQDFSSTMFEGEGNYFTDLFKFHYRTDSYGVTGFTMSDDFCEDIGYDKVNNKFGSGEFFVDSFTYTPFIDHS